MHEMIIKGGNGVTVRGRWWVHDEAVTVRSSYGQEKTNHIGGSPPHALARLMLLEMAEDQLGYQCP
jgi:hypothetical protein